MIWSVFIYLSINSSTSLTFKRCVILYFLSNIASILSSFIVISNTIALSSVFSTCNVLILFIFIVLYSLLFNSSGTSSSL